MPSRNTEGNQVWNPSVGIYFKPAANQRESYGGIIGALNDNIQTQGGDNKAYPHNFAGIIAAMFIERKQVIEPSQYPTVEARVNFEEKLNKEMNEVGDKFEASYKRGGITTLEIIFALAQGLNLDDVELAYVILNSNF